MNVFRRQSASLCRHGWTDRGRGWDKWDSVMVPIRSMLRMLLEWESRQTYWRSGHVVLQDPQQTECLGKVILQQLIVFHCSEFIRDNIIYLILARSVSSWRITWLAYKNSTSLKRDAEHDSFSIHTRPHSSPSSFSPKQAKWPWRDQNLDPRDGLVIQHDPWNRSSRVVEEKGAIWRPRSRSLALIWYATSSLAPFSSCNVPTALVLGTMAALLQEIVSVYPLLSPPALTAHASNRVCNALALLQCVASHSETRQLFLNGKHYLRTIFEHLVLIPLCYSTYTTFLISFPQYHL